MSKAATGPAVLPVGLRKRELLLALGAILVLGACSATEVAEPSTMTSAPGSTTTTEAAPNTTDEQTESTEDGTNQPISAPIGFWELVEPEDLSFPGYPAFVIIDDGSLTKYTGYSGDKTRMWINVCSVGSTAVEFENGRFVWTGLPRTLNHCRPPLKAPEDRFFDRIKRFKQYRFDGDQLVLYAESGELVFDPVHPPPPESFDQEWVLEAVIEGGTRREAVGEPAGLLMGADGTASVATGCATVHGDLLYSGAYAHIIPPDPGEGLECPSTQPAAVESQHRLVQTVRDGFKATLDNGRLVLTDWRRNENQLIYRPNG